MAKMHLKKNKNTKKPNPAETKNNFYSLLNIENNNLNTYHIAHVKNYLFLITKVPKVPNSLSEM